MREPKAPIVHEDVPTRVLRGKAKRREMPRSDLAAWEPAASRIDPATILRQQEVTRVAELIPLRHERMTASPFAFYRGAAAIMAADLGSGPQTGLWAQCCGDAHLANFGGFASPDRSLVFDLNDFDETSRGPFEWDVKRLAASFEIGGRSIGLDDESRRDAVIRVGRSYRDAMAGFASMTNLATWYARLDMKSVLKELKREVPGRAEVLKRAMRKAESKDHLKAFRKLTEAVDDDVRFVSDPPTLVPLRELFEDADRDELFEWLRDQFRAYRRTLQPPLRLLLERYRLVDFARKVVGVGSVGTRCWVGLFLGRDEEDPLFLQIKEAQPSVLEAHTGGSKLRSNGQRVVEGQRLVQAASDIMLGWLTTTGIDGVKRDFYVRQLWDGKFSAEVETMEPDAFTFYAYLCGWTLARAHAVSGDPVAIAAYLGGSEGFDLAIADFAGAYAAQNERDFDAVRARGIEPPPVDARTTRPRAGTNEPTTPG